MRDLYYTTKTLHAEYLTSYTNTLQLIEYQYFTQCKILQIPPTRILHDLHTATRHKHGRMTSRHRGAEKSVTPTDSSTSLWRKTHRIRQNRLQDNGVGCVRCMQGSVRCCQCHLHTTYTTYTLPHGTSMGGQYHSIGEQKSLLLRQISLRPRGVQATAYDKTDCKTAGCDV